MRYHSLSDVIRCYPWVQFLLTLPQFFRKTSVASLLIPNPKALCWSTCPYHLELQRCTWSFWRRKLKTSSSICCLATATPTLNPTCHQISNMAGKSMEIPYLYLFISISPYSKWAFTPENHSLGMFHGHFWPDISGASWAAGGSGFTTRWSPRSATSRTVWGAKVLVPWRCGERPAIGLSRYCLHAPWKKSYCILFVFDIDLLNM